MSWTDSGHVEPAPRGQNIDIPATNIGKVFRDFGPTRVLAERPVGKITTDPRGRQG